MQIDLPARINHRSDTFLSPNDLISLRNLRTRQLVILVPVYLLILGVFLFTMISGRPFPVKTPTVTQYQINAHADDSFSIAPLICGILLLLATVFVIIRYKRWLGPVTKDIRTGMKSLLYFYPVKTTSPGQRYFISTPLIKPRQLEIGREEYDLVSEKEELCLELGPQSLLILRLTKNGREINYY